MADTKLSDLTALTTTSDDDLLYVVDDPAGTPADRKLALSNVFKRGSVTTSSPVIDAAQTWNNSGVTFTGLRFNAAGSSNTNSASGSLLMDIQLEGTSRFSVSKNNIDINNGVAFNASGIITIGSTDTILSRRGTANLRLGVADAAAPVAQTLSVQSVVAGTSNTAGANLTITGSQGTGTGAGGSIIFQVAPAGSSGSAQNALSTVLTMSASGVHRLGADSTHFLEADSTYTALGTFASAGNNMGFYVRDVMTFGAANANNGSPAPDLFIYRDAANILAQRNGANAQAFRVYNTFTDASNYERMRLQWSGNEARIGPESAGTGGTRSMGLYQGNTRYQIIGGGFNQFDQAIYMNAVNIVTDTTTGFKIGTATNQKISFFNATPVVQPTAVVDATDAATVITQLNALLSRMRNLGLIAA